MITPPQKSSLIKAACLCAGILASGQAIHAADILQSRTVPSGSTWNDSINWGDNPVVAGNTYIMQSLGGTPTTAFTVNGTTWTFGSTMRDAEGGSTFSGGSLVLASGTRLLGKVSNGSTSTVNLVFNGGLFYSGANGPGSATLAGTISFGSGIDLGAIGVNPNGTATLFTFNVSSTVIGDSSDTLQLTLLTENSGLRLGRIVFNGDISGFAGTLYVGTAASGAAVGSSYSIQSSSDLTALVLDTTTLNFSYDLATDETFGALTVGGTILGAGTYDMAELNNIAGGSFFTGAGTITVVPEPGTTALTVVALMGTAAILRFRTGRLAA